MSTVIVRLEPARIAVYATHPDKPGERICIAYGSHEIADLIFDWAIACQASAKDFDEGLGYGRVPIWDNGERDNLPLIHAYGPIGSDDVPYTCPVCGGFRDCTCEAGVS